jgi:hypothetical protein
MNQKIPEIDEQIAQLIASLPSERLLQQAKTPAQIEEWHKARQIQIILAECWKSKWLVKDYYPVEEAVKRQEISQRKAELINSCVNEKKAGVGALPSCRRICQKTPRTSPNCGAFSQAIRPFLVQIFSRS